MQQLIGQHELSTQYSQHELGGKEVVHSKYYQNLSIAIFGLSTRKEGTVL